MGDVDCVKGHWKICGNKSSLNERGGGLLRVVFIFILIVLSSACSTVDTSEQEPDLIGYVMEKTEDRMLVVSQEPQDFSQTGGVKEFYNATWLSNVQADIAIGELVKVWFEGGVAESYPSQTKLGKFEIIKTERPEGADLSTDQVIRKALMELEQLVAIRSLQYDREKDRWDIEFKTIFEEEDLTIHVKDEK